MPSNVTPPPVTRHTRDAASYQARHDASVRSPLVTLSILTGFSRLLKARLDGLFVAGDEGADFALPGLTPSGFGCVSLLRHPTLAARYQPKPSAAAGCAPLMGLSPEPVLEVDRTGRVDQDFGRACP